MVELGQSYLPGFSPKEVPEVSRHYSENALVVVPKNLTPEQQLTADRYSAVDMIYRLHPKILRVSRFEDLSPEIQQQLQDVLDRFNELRIDGRIAEMAAGGIPPAIPSFFIVVEPEEITH